MTTRARYVSIACGIGAILLVILGLLFARSSPPPASIHGFLFVGTPVNTGGIFSLSISNSSHAEVAYIACPPQMKSNGAWLEMQMPTGPTAPTRLPPRTPGTLLVHPPSQPRTWRVPVFWRYQPSMADALKGRAQNFVAHVLGTKPPGSAIEGYTNYPAEIMQ